MPEQRIIRDREIVVDPWTLIRDDAPIPDTGDVLVGLERLRGADFDALEKRSGRLGVAVQGHDDEDAVAAVLEHVDLVTVNFPKFTDGRGYSLARLIRSRFAYKGELRAVGDVLPDQLFFMARCGFNAFGLRADQKLETGLNTLKAFSVTYQAGEDDPRPLYRRR